MIRKLALGAVSGPETPFGFFLSTNEGPCVGAGRSQDGFFVSCSSGKGQVVSLELYSKNDVETKREKMRDQSSKGAGRG